MRHLDLFSGIGGFALALDWLTPTEHIFCEIDPFAQRVLKKHWTNSPIHNDIRTLSANNIPANPLCKRLERCGTKSGIQWAAENTRCPECRIDIITGGFPCQPFSSAGLRKGTDDSRHLWPEMLRIVGECRPRWVLAENVRGLLSIGGGLAFEQVCLGLEGLGYEVWPCLVPAAGVGAPHRRDRVWIAAHTNGQGLERGMRERGEHRQYDRRQGQGWNQDWRKVAARLCGMDDGLSGGVDGLTPAKHRAERLKALGNAIVPQVAYEILKSMLTQKK